MITLEEWDAPGSTYTEETHPFSGLFPPRKRGMNYQITAAQLAYLLELSLPPGGRESSLEALALPFRVDDDTRLVTMDFRFIGVLTFIIWRDKNRLYFRELAKDGEMARLTALYQEAIRLEVDRLLSGLSEG